LSWLWAFSGVMPWAMLDEPTLGQDRATRAALADAIARLSQSGYGVVFITHDDDFAAHIAHRPLRIADGVMT
jgi:energy-coupling factor transporter ATP-binding protein EcfA2